MTFGENKVGAKRSEEMKTALELVKKQQVPIKEAAKIAGVWYTSLYAVLKKEKESQNETIYR